MGRREGSLAADVLDQYPEAMCCTHCLWRAGAHEKAASRAAWVEDL